MEIYILPRLETVLDNSKPHANMYAEGRMFLTTSQGETATWTGQGQGLGNRTPESKTRFRGSHFFAFTQVIAPPMPLCSCFETNLIFLILVFDLLLKPWKSIY